MTDFIDEMCSRDDADDSDAVTYLFGKGRRRLDVMATTLEYAWQGLDIALGDGGEADDWTLLSIDGEVVVD
jgi:hypothetical protein